MSEKAVLLLERARDLIKTKGWGQGAYWTSDPEHGKICFCARGAVLESSRFPSDITTPNYGSTLRIYSDAIGILEPLVPGRVGIATYNDHPTTTKDDVIALFDKAIQQEEAES